MYFKYKGFKIWIDKNPESFIVINTNLNTEERLPTLKETIETIDLWLGKERKEK